MKYLMKISILIVAAAIMISGCSIKKELQERVYRNENNPGVTLTVSNLTDFSDEVYYKKCELQFSSDYDFSTMTAVFSQMIFNVYSSANKATFDKMTDEEYEKKSNIMMEEISKNLDLKKQFSDNACEFYIGDIEDNDFDIMETKVDGIDKYVDENALYLAIKIFDDGSLLVEPDGQVFK